MAGIAVPPTSPAASLARRLPSLVAEYRAARSGKASPGSAALSRPELAAAGAALLSLQRGLTGERSLAGAPYMDDPELLGAYLLYYWPVSYLQVSLALAELGLAPRRVLDLGSGPGPAATAALDAARALGGEAELLLVDGSRPALDLAARVLGASSTAPRLETRELDLRAGMGALGQRGGFDLVVMGHCLNELWRGREDRLTLRLGLLEAAAALLAPGGALLVVEPALLATSREVLALRDLLSARGYPILGPCPRARAGAYPCPALAAGADRSCHAQAAWEPPEPVASLAAAAGLDRRSVKATWLAFGPPPMQQPAVQHAAAGDKAVPQAPAALSGRVVSDPMLNKAGRVRYFVCAEGRLATVSAAKDSPEARSSGFLELRRGDLIRLEEPEARPGGSLGLAAASRLELLARAPEPIQSRGRGGER